MILVIIRFFVIIGNPIICNCNQSTSRWLMPLRCKFLLKILIIGNSIKVMHSLSVPIMTDWYIISIWNALLCFFVSALRNSCLTIFVLQRSRRIQMKWFQFLLTLPFKINLLSNDIKQIYRNLRIILFNTNKFLVF